MKEILTMGWWLYVFIVFIPELFVWEGLDQLFLKFLVMLVMLVVPMIFWND